MCRKRGAEPADVKALKDKERGMEERKGVPEAGYNISED